MNISKDTKSLPAFALLNLENTSPDDLEAEPSVTLGAGACPDGRAGFNGVKQASAWSYCGPLLHAKSLEEMPHTFQKWQDESIKGNLLSMILPILHQANDFLASNDLQHYWITVRATKPDTEFEKPRWHTDDLFYERYLSREDGERSLGGAPAKRFWPAVAPMKMPKASGSEPTDWKLIATLSGPTTLLIAHAHQKQARQLQRKAKVKCGKEHVCDSIRCVGCSTAASHVRDTLDQQLRLTPIVRPGVRQTVYLRVGHERGAIHSEPDLSHCDRVFVNIVPGTEAELAGLMRKWGMEFPREWAVTEGIIS